MKVNKKKLFANVLREGSVYLQYFSLFMADVAEHIDPRPRAEIMRSIMEKLAGMPANVQMIDLDLGLPPTSKKPSSDKN